MLNNKFYVSNFVRDFISNDHNDNSVVSPLGAWVNLVILAKSVKSELTTAEEEEIVCVLDSSIDDAFESLKVLHDTVPEFLVFAIGFWGLYKTSKTYSKIAETIKEIDVDLVRNIMPTNKVLDPWVAENSLNLIEKFPVDLDGSGVDALLANILALKIDWDDIYEEVKSRRMSFWGADDSLYLGKDVGQHTRIVDIDNEHYGLHVNSKSYYEEGYSVSVYSLVGNKNVSKEKLNVALQKLFVSGERAITVDNDFFRNHRLDFVNVKFKKKRTSERNPDYNVYYPAWDASTTTDLNDLDGFSTLSKVLNRDEIKIDNQQVAVSSYSKEGFEAAALTYGMMTRSSMPVMLDMDIAEVDVFFDKPFVTATVIKPLNLKTKKWFTLPLFVSYICKGK